MRFFLIFISLIVSSFFILSLTNKIGAEEEWIIDKYETLAYARVSGEVIHGDNLNFFFNQEQIAKKCRITLHFIHMKTLET